MPRKEKFDVFMSYSRSDTASAEFVAEALRSAGLRVWLDRWELVPGESWEEALQGALDQASSIAVFVGPSGLAPSQQRELQTIIRGQVSDHRARVIPVLLPGSDFELLSPFLRNRVAVDLRDTLTDPQALNRLVAAIESSGGSGEISRDQRMADDLRASGDVRGAVSLYDRALSTARAAYGDAHPLVASLLIRLGNAKRDLGDYSSALRLSQEAVAIITSLHGEESPELTSALNNLGAVLRDQGRLQEAHGYFLRALEIDERNVGPDHPNVARDLNNLAALLQDTNRLAEAEPLMRRALAIDEKSLGPDHPNVAIRLNNLAALLQGTNRLAEAEPLMRRALVPTFVGT
jgi:tetratricopeptide (TPR) repeat protein